MKYLTLLLLIFALPTQAQTPPPELRLFETWQEVEKRPVGTGTMTLYYRLAVPTDTARVWYDQDEDIRVLRATVDGERWALSLSGEWYVITPELQQMYQLALEDTSNASRLTMMLFDRSRIGVDPAIARSLEYMWMDRAIAEARPTSGPTPGAPGLMRPVRAAPAPALEAQDLTEITRMDAIRVARSDCDVTDLIGECIEPPVPVVRSN